MYLSLRIKKPKLFSIMWLKSIKNCSLENPCSLSQRVKVIMFFEFFCYVMKILIWFDDFFENLHCIFFYTPPGNSADYITGSGSNITKRTLCVYQILIFRSCSNASFSFTCNTSKPQQVFLKAFHFQPNELSYKICIVITLDIAWRQGDRWKGPLIFLP